MVRVRLEHRLSHVLFLKAQRTSKMLLRNTKAKLINTSHCDENRKQTIRLANFKFVEKLSLILTASFKTANLVS